VKPRKTQFAVLDRLAKRIEEHGEQRHREHLARIAPVVRPACTRHGWHPPGPGTLNMDALASLCPLCRAERQQAEREAEAPEVQTLDVFGGSVREQQAWAEHLDRRARNGELLPGSVGEIEALGVINEARAEEEAALRETAADRRRYHAEHWGRKFRVHTQRYQPHPARAGR
jgi:hypothetical protein